MGLRLYNTLHRNIETFASKEPNTVKLYTCGPTVYDYLSVGNWAAYIYWDILVRVLEANGYTVERVMNITDVGHLVSDADEGEDKLEKGAKREGKSAWEVAKFYTDDFMRGMEKLNLLKPTHMPKATDYIDQQLQLVRQLKNKGVTYKTSDGIYFDTAKFSTYAAFAGLDLDEQRAGARVAINEEKRNASDFALWKFTPAGEKRDMVWPTPDDLMDDGDPRNGFPGWHLECSAMALDLLGSTLDIHTGGIDHIPVHHTNEIAQSEMATGSTFSHYWLHNNHLKVNGTKISKSLNNGYTLDDLEDRGFGPDDLRMFVLQGHYRSEGNFTFENLTAAKNRLHHWKNVTALRFQVSGSQKQFEDEYEKVLELLSDDLNTPAALSYIDDLLSQIEQQSAKDLNSSSLNKLFSHIDSLLGLRLIHSTSDITDEQKHLIAERLKAREEKDWARSDEIREKLLVSGIGIRDTKTGTFWEYA